MINLVDFVEAIPFSFAALVPMLNPLGGSITFLTLSMGKPEKEVHHLAARVALNTFFLLFVVLVAGAWVLRFFGITIPVVQVAGGLVISYIAWSFLHQLPNSFATHLTTYVKTDKEPSDLSFFPLTMPITAGPGCIAVTLTIGAHHAEKSFVETLLGQMGAVVGIFLAAFVVFLCYRNAYRITRALGQSGTQAIRRISSFINLCIGIQIMWHGISSLLLLAH